MCRVSGVWACRAALAAALAAGLAGCGNREAERRAAEAERRVSELEAKLALLEQDGVVVEAGRRVDVTGELDVEVRRAPGAALGKALTVSWTSNLGYGRFLGER